MLWQSKDINSGLPDSCIRLSLVNLINMSQSSRDWSYMGVFKAVTFWTWKKQNRKTNLRSGDSIQEKQCFFVTFLLAPNTNAFTWSALVLIITHWYRYKGASQHAPHPASAQLSTLLAKGANTMISLPFIKLFNGSPTHSISQTCVATESFKNW